MSDRLTQIRERVAKATPGPWQAVDTTDDTYIIDDGDMIVGACERVDDAVFAAEAREDIPFLLTQLDAAHTDIRNSSEVLAEAQRMIDDLQAQLTAECQRADALQRRINEEAE